MQLHPAFVILINDQLPQQYLMIEQIFDLIERAEKENIPGIIYFEKALDTVEWFFFVRKS
jgi:hypothetical protein